MVAVHSMQVLRAARSGVVKAVNQVAGAVRTSHGHVTACNRYPQSCSTECCADQTHSGHLFVPRMNL